MSTPTSSTLSSPATLSQTGKPRPADVIAMGRKAEPDNSSLNNDHVTPVASQVDVGAIKPVDRRTIEGSTPGDHRAPANTNDLTGFAKNPPGPREGVCQSQVTSSKLQEKPASAPYIGESLASNS